MKVVPVELGLTIKLRSAVEFGSAVRWRTRRDGSTAWGGNVGDDDEDWR